MSIDINPDDKGGEAERYAHDLASKKYFSPWCHANPRNPKTGKEICDLLILFRSTVVILSIKNHAFDGNYIRHHRRSVEKGVRQIYGAHRILGELESIRVAGQDYQVRDYSQLKVLRVLLNLGDPLPFYYGVERDRLGNIVHVFDRTAFNGVVEELDTVADLVEYLTVREDWLRDKEFQMAPLSEEHYTAEVNMNWATGFPQRHSPGLRHFFFSGSEMDLLALCLRNFRDIPPEFKEIREEWGLLQFDGEWDKLKTHPKFIKRKERDEISRLVDSLAADILHDNLDAEPIARELMSMNRTERRMFSMSLMGFFEGNHRGGERYVARRYMKLEFFSAVFMYFSADWPVDEQEELMAKTLELYAYKKGYERDTILVIARDPSRITPKCMMLRYSERFSIEEERELDRWIQLLGWFTQEHESTWTEKEFPDVEAA